MLASYVVVFAGECNELPESLQRLNGAFEADRSGMNGVLGCSLSHDRADQIVGEDVRPNFLFAQALAFCIAACPSASRFSKIADLIRSSKPSATKDLSCIWAQSEEDVLPWVRADALLLLADHLVNSISCKQLEPIDNGGLPCPGRMSPPALRSEHSDSNKSSSERTLVELETDSAGPSDRPTDDHASSPAPQTDGGAK